MSICIYTYKRREGEKSVEVCLLHVVVQNMHREPMRLCVTELLYATPHKQSFNKLQQSFTNITITIKNGSQSVFSSANGCIYSFRLVALFIYTHIYIHIYTHTYMCIYIHINIHTHIYTHTHIYILYIYSKVTILVTYRRWPGCFYKGAYR